MTEQEGEAICYKPDAASFGSYEVWRRVETHQQKRGRRRIIRYDVVCVPRHAAMIVRIEEWSEPDEEGEWHMRTEHQVCPFVLGDHQHYKALKVIQRHIQTGLWLLREDGFTPAAAPEAVKS